MATKRKGYNTTIRLWPFRNTGRRVNGSPTLSGRRACFSRPAVRLPSRQRDVVRSGTPSSTIEERHSGSKFEKITHSCDTVRRVGWARPREVVAITQILIDAWELNAVDPMPQFSTGSTLCYGHRFARFFLLLFYYPKFYT